ncbi:hypothetical protein VPNG_03543 [Cytospora leucostoma]|uniref:Uncharacterized protein n=1 Tax=Cytospora leucostoma TaxID=1230097 RepID=A0A423XCW9_9PEZI|nr:hypothetical protein VPNG_03543 [Cytospora leucostoma]
MGELEPWDYLAAYQALRTQAADEVATTTASCAQNHPQHKHVIQCRECYPQIIKRIRSTYLEPKDGQWFSGREAFLADLDALFAAALHYEARLGDVDARIENEKRDWYFEQVKASPSIPKTLEELLDRKDLVAKLGSKEVAFEGVIQELRAALSGGADPKTAQEILGRLIAVQTPEERLQAYRDIFFQGRPGEQISEKAQIYFDKLQDGATLKDVIAKVSSDAAASIAAPDQKERHQKRIEELRRAKAAYEKEKEKKATQKPQPPEKTYDAPPCNVCRKDVDLGNFIGCPYCTVLLEAGVRVKTTVWCSQDAHVEEKHRCAGGERCVQLVEDDIYMDLDNADDYLCRECMELKIESVYCSIRCAELNFQSHREDLHIRERRKQDFAVDRDLDDLVFDEPNRSRYHSRAIRSRLAAIGELMGDLRQRHGMNP